MSIEQAIEAIKNFQGDSLTRSISCIEGIIKNQKMGAKEIQAICASRQIDDAFIASALSIKQLAGQINVIIHAAGILHSLPKILKHGEVVISLSLGAGNTGRKFDLETDCRVAEYKFIDWQGGSETIRQNALFKDFYELAEDVTTKEKYLYVVGEKYPRKFFEGGRTLSSVLSRHSNILDAIRRRYPKNITRVCDYYKLKKHEVMIEDVTPHLGAAYEAGIGIR